jgi:hypothetical protein
MMLDVNPMPDDIGNEDRTLYLETYKPPFLALLVIVFPIIPLFWSYSVKVTKDHLTIGYSYPVVAKAIDRSSLQEAIPVETVNGLMEWGGWGIRLRPSHVQAKEEQKNKSRWETGYIAKNGGAVKVVLNDEKESIYYFSCDSPQEVCDILNEKDDQKE